MDFVSRRPFTACVGDEGVEPPLAVLQTECLPVSDESPKLIFYASFRVYENLTVSIVGPVGLEPTKVKTEGFTVPCNCRYAITPNQNGMVCFIKSEVCVCLL